VRRGEIWWADLPKPRGSEPGFRRPVLIVQDNAFNRSKINTVIVATITSNVFLASAPGNVRLAKRSTKLGKESVVNVSQIITLDKSFLSEKVGKLSAKLQEEINEGLKLIFAL